MSIVYGVEEARRTLLRRRAPEEADLPAAVRRTLELTFGEGMDAAAAVRRILADVRDEGDAALHRYNQAFDGCGDAPIEVTPEEIDAAEAVIDGGLRQALEMAAERIRIFHENQLRHAATSFLVSGVGQAVRPLERVGLYMPGVRVVYPSSVLMTAIPARVAGVKQVHMATPAEPDGAVSPLKLAAARIAGVDRVFRIGGAQAVAAFAYGTETVPKADKVLGPGNIFVTLAKRQVYGIVGVDGIYGPSETIVIADENADPSHCAADLLAQAEHDELATPILITTSSSLAEMVAAEVEQQLEHLARKDVARSAWEAQGGIAVVDTLDDALELANEYAPEHLCLLVQNAQALLNKVRNAGGAFLGDQSPEALGDYMVGPSHVMPTGGSARFASPLGVHDFLKVTLVAGIDGRTLQKLGPPAAAVAHAEGFQAHARAIERRLEGQL